MRRLPVVLSLFLLMATDPAQAAGGGGDDKPAASVAAAKGVRDLQLAPSQTLSEPIKGVRLNITQFSYPGVPERASCRTVIRVENTSEHTIAFYSLIRTFDTQQVPLSTWMTPSGELPPGKSGERLYSCKLARYMVLDRGSAGGWPNTCLVDGDERSPCPLELTFDANMDLLPEPATKNGKKP
ncbi:MAG: Uncharacterized protein FD119_2631 [Stygiobacter sp.]|nr:MAG: Uncharacterized protein FD119_2631 [Stygiobacter sp.]